MNKRNIQSTPVCQLFFLCKLQILLVHAKATVSAKERERGTNKRQWQKPHCDSFKTFWIVPMVQDSVQKILSRASLVALLKALFAGIV